MVTGSYIRNQGPGGGGKKNVHWDLKLRAKIRTRGVDLKVSIVVGMIK